jgi:glutamine amidotransferase
MKKIVIIDYGMGNLHSVYKKINSITKDHEIIISSRKEDIETADKLILPGVGHFKKAIENINKLDLWDVINDQVLINKKPILGICLGMQLMANHSEEGDVNGFGWINAEVVRFNINDRLKFKIPHMGWNQIEIHKDSLLMKNIPSLSEFYFVHSFHFICHDEADILNTTVYEKSFVSSIQKDTIFGVQYHPEKSHDVGELLLKNFIL